jgi:Putative MetA-pathway of phenol degradation
MKRPSLVPALLLAACACLAAPDAAFACSICRCGDPTFNALGKDGFAAQGFRAALDWERFDKDQGDPALESESQVENRFTAFLSYGFSEKFTLIGRVPWSVRNLTGHSGDEPPEQVRSSGLSDPELGALVRLWASRFSGSLGRRASLSLSGGVKTALGQSDYQVGGARADEHAQPGTGATDAYGNLAFLYLFDKSSSLFVSAGYRRTGTNRYGYRYGSSALASAAYEHKLGGRLDAVAELDFRHAGQDRVDASGALDGDTGGTLLYASPRLLLSLGHGLVARAAAQIPVARRLNGFQTERTVVNLGVTYVFGR